MNKCDEWFKSLTEAFEKKTASFINPDRDKKLKPKKNKKK